MNTYALILAGGSGTRFWPLSRNTKPKQLIHLLGEKSLIQLAFDRISPLIPAERILVLTNDIQADEVRRQLPEIPSENVISEPLRRDTAPAVCLGIALIARRDPKASMIILPSDQLIQNDAAFRDLAAAALKHASETEALVTIGVKPTWACPSFGYIERGGRVSSSSSANCYEVKQFREKPDAATAAMYLQKGNFSWNAGIFIWSVKTVCAELRRHQAQLADFVDALACCEDPQAFILSEFPKLKPISIDYALMEHAQAVHNFEATFDWDDVGSWISMAQYLPQHEGNASNAELTSLGAKGNIVFTTSKQKRVVLLGVEDLIVVETDDALLVTRRDRADQIKDVVSLLPPELH